MKRWNGHAGKVLDLKTLIARKSADSLEFKNTVEKARAAHELARQLADARKKQGLSQRALAKLLGTSQPQIHRIESERYDGTSLSTMVEAATALHHRVVIRLEPISAEPLRRLASNRDGCGSSAAA